MLEMSRIYAALTAAAIVSLLASETYAAVPTCTVGTSVFFMMNAGTV